MTLFLLSGQEIYIRNLAQGPAGVCVCTDENSELGCEFRLKHPLFLGDQNSGWHFFPLETIYVLLGSDVCP